jgi:hypothetical protein
MFGLSGKNTADGSAAEGARLQPAIGTLNKTINATTAKLARDTF